MVTFAFFVVGLIYILHSKYKIYLYILIYAAAPCAYEVLHPYLIGLHSLCKLMNFTRSHPGDLSSSLL